MTTTTTQFGEPTLRRRRRLIRLAAALAVALGILAAIAKANEPPDWRVTSKRLQAETLPFPYPRMVPLAKPVPEPGPNDWLAQHAEPGQSLAAYIRSSPVRPTKQRGVLYLQPIGPFDETQERVLAATETFLAAYFQIPVRRLDPVGLDTIPADARRDGFDAEQLLTTYIMDDVLKPRRPKDAVALVGLTAVDLWPGDGWNFVFGQASFRDRVGIWSMARFGDPSESDEAYRLCLLRTITTAVHETGHMLGMYHCITYSCVMNGSNNLPESDRAPLALCPVCSAKLNWNLQSNPVNRARALAAACRKIGLPDEAAVYDTIVEALINGAPAKK